MISRKLVFLGLVGFYSSMPIKAEALSDGNKLDFGTFIQDHKSEIIIGYAAVTLCSWLYVYYTLNQAAVLTPKQLERVAYHEIGHTLVALHNEPILGSTFHNVTIISRLGTLGLTTTLPSEGSMNLLTKDQYLAHIRFLLGGYVAEELMYGQTSTTVTNDLQMASSIARQMVTSCGMHANTGKVFYEMPTFLSGQTYSQETMQKIDTAVQQIVEEQYEWVKAFLGEKNESLKLLGDELLKEKTLTSKQVKELLGVISSEKSVTA